MKSGTDDKLLIKKMLPGCLNNLFLLKVCAYPVVRPEIFLMNLQHFAACGLNTSLFIAFPAKSAQKVPMRPSGRTKAHGRFCNLGLCLLHFVQTLYLSHPFPGASIRGSEWLTFGLQRTGDAGLVGNTPEDCCEERVRFLSSWTVQTAPRQVPNDTPLTPNLASEGRQFN